MANSNWAKDNLPADIIDRELARRQLARGRVVTIDLDAPETWPTSVWVAFSKANHERIVANVEANESRRVGQAGAHIV